MSDIKIFVTHTSNRNNKTVEDDVFCHTVAGADFNTTPTDKNVDNTGDNISSRNKSYCELTTQYWAWKNTKHDYYGFFHYRRYMSFAEKELPESNWGTIEYDYISSRAIEELHLNRKDIEKKVAQYDFIISKGIDIRTLGFKSTYEHYRKAIDLHQEDYDIFLQVIKEKYPKIYPYAQEYSNGYMFYPCNMFIMNNELFDEYSAMLFDILAEYENRADMTNYSKEGIRVTGHLGERMLGIYYLYILAQKKYKTTELQIALFKNTEADKELLPSASNAVPVVMAANDFYAPILATCLQSVMDTSSDNRNYDIAVFHKDITEANQAIMQSMVTGHKNIRLDFVNIGSRVDGYKLQAKEHITTETFYRFLILDVMKAYKNVIYIDCDLIVKRDLAELYDINLGTNLIGAVRDADFTGQLNNSELDTMNYCRNVMKLKDPFSYFQAGVLLLNVPELNKAVTVRKLLDMADTGIYKYSDQDILNVVCEDRVTYLDMAWNMITDCDHYRVKYVISHAPNAICDEYHEARKHPYVIHYAGFLKPWKKPTEDMAQEFWVTARKTPYYEVLLQRLYSDGVVAAPQQAQPDKYLNTAFKRKMYYSVYLKLCPEGSKRREVLRKIVRKMRHQG